MSKNITFVAVVSLIMLIVPGTTRAADASVELNINDSDLEARFDVFVDPFQTPLTAGAGFLYSDDDEFWLANINVAVKDEVGAPGLNLGLGFKGLMGETDVAEDDFTTAALAFQFLGEYDFRESGANLPISITASLAWAPEVLSFSDTEDYFEIYSAVYLHINYWASIFVGYRNIEIDYEDVSGSEGEHDAFYFGARLSF